MSEEWKDNGFFNIICGILKQDKGEILYKKRIHKYIERMKIMIDIIKFEIKKIVGNLAFLGASIVVIIVMGGIFFTGIYYSQLSLIERHNKTKGENNLYKQVVEKNYGTFDDKRVREILSDFMMRYQSYDDFEKRPNDFFSRCIADVFFSLSDDVYSKMNEAIEVGDKITVDQIDISTIDEIGFSNFENPLIIGNYVTWNDLYKITGYVSILVGIISILLCSLSFSNDTAKNINQLLLSTNYGRSKLTIAKMFAGTFLCSIIYFVLIIVCFVVFLIYNNGISGWDASFQTNFLMRFFSFSLEVNNFEVWLIIVLFNFFGILTIVGVTLVISSLTKTPFSSLAISLGLFILPLLLTFIFREGTINALINLFPINSFDAEKMLTVLDSGNNFMFGSFLNNYSLVLIVMFLIKLFSDILIYNRQKNY